MKKLFCVLAVLVLFAAFFSAAKAQDTCWAYGNVNGDEYVLTVGDFVLGIRILTCGVEPPDSLYQLDLNADCQVDSADLRVYHDLFTNYIFYGIVPPPPYFPVATCCNPTVHPYFRGDLNNDGDLSPADAVLMVSCVMVGTGNCHLFYADLTGDFQLSPADVVQELNYVFNGTAPVGCP